MGGSLMDGRRGPGFFTAFYTRRAFRIFPVYYVALSLMLIVSYPAEGGCGTQITSIRLFMLLTRRTSWQRCEVWMGRCSSRFGRWRLKTRRS